MEPSLERNNYIVDILTQDAAWKSVIPTIEEICQATISLVLDEYGFADYAGQLDVSILLTDDEHIRKLNNDYRNKDTATNVLSFPGEELSPDALNQLIDSHRKAPLMLGDIVIALQTIERESSEQGKNIQHHFQHMIVHSVLHLLGYDHQSDTEEATMQKKEIAILEKLHVPNPYQDIISSCNACN